MFENKKQLIRPVKQLIEDESFRKCTNSYKLLIFGEEVSPVEINNGGVVINRTDIATTHKESDTILIQLLMMCNRNNNDDIDVFVLLLQ